MNGERKKGKYKVQDTMHRIFGRDNQYGKEYGQKRDEIKCIHGYYYKTLCPSKKSWAKV